MTPDVGTINVALSETPGLLEMEGDIEEGNTDDNDVAEDPPNTLLNVDERDPIPTKDMPGVEVTDVPLTETLGLEVKEISLVGMLGLKRDPVPEVEALGVEITDVALIETPGLLDTDPMMEDTIVVKITDVLLTGTLVLPDPVMDITMPEAEVAVVLPMALLTLPVKDPRPEVDVARVETTGVPLIEIVGLQR